MIIVVNNRDIFDSWESSENSTIPPKVKISSDGEWLK